MNLVLLKDTRRWAIVVLTTCLEVAALRPESKMHNLFVNSSLALCVILSPAECPLQYLTTASWQHEGSFVLFHCLLLSILWPIESRVVHLWNVANLHIGITVKKLKHAKL